MSDKSALSEFVSPIIAAVVTFAILAGLLGLAIMAFKFLMTQIGGL